MKKRRILIFCIIIACIATSLKLYKTYKSIYAPPKFMAPLTMMVNDTLYKYSTTLTDTSSIDIILTEPAGTINEIIKGELPTKNNQSTFGEPGMDYWFVEPDSQENVEDDLLYVKYHDDFFIFKRWGYQHETTASS